MQNILLILMMFLATLFLGCKKNGTCDQTATAKFRNFKVSFPITGYDIIKLSHPKKKFTADYIEIDSLIPGISAKWFTSRYQNEHYPTDTIQYLKDAQIYGVSFYLWSEHKRDNADFLNELSKIYPGEYLHVKEPGANYYINHQPCMSVIFSRIPYDAGQIPIVSFTYGISASAEDSYGRAIGKLANWD